MLDLNCTILSQVVDQAMTDAAGHPRWLKAITRAVTELLSNPYIARQDGHLLIASSSSERIYAANGTCQCIAHEYGEACWHRAAARLVRRHDEVVAYNAVERPAAGLMPMPEGDTLDTDGMRVEPAGDWNTRYVAWAKAQREIGELFDY